MKQCLRCAEKPAKGGRGLCKGCYDWARYNNVLHGFPASGQQRSDNPDIQAWLQEHVPEYESLSQQERNNAYQRARYHVDEEYRNRHKQTTAVSRGRRVQRERVETEQTLDAIMRDYLKGLDEVPEEPVKQRAPCVRCARRIAPWGEEVCTDCLAREVRAKPEEVFEWLAL